MRPENQVLVVGSIVILLFLFGLGFESRSYGKTIQKCQERGGAMVRVNGVTRCVKTELIPLQ